MEGVSPGGGGTLVCFACEDGAVEQGRVEAVGGQAIKPKFSIAAHGHIALDPDMPPAVQRMALAATRPGTCRRGGRPSACS